MSAVRVADLPADRGAEIAFAGRSNAGKSSLLNALCRQTALARVSRTPGRTQALNVFALATGRVVDLPGYGYAHAPRARRDQWLELVADYLSLRRSLCSLVWVMDARHPLHPTDLQFQELIGSARAPVIVALTKADQLGRGALAEAVAQSQARLGPFDIEVLACSARSGAGIDTLRARLAAVLPRAPQEKKAAPE
jgi:GTP-binding protein